jgi:hypothetical protein
MRMSRTSRMKRTRSRKEERGKERKLDKERKRTTHTINAKELWKRITNS